jgi:hypothetical protein
MGPFAVVNEEDEKVPDSRPSPLGYDQVAPTVRR